MLFILSGIALQHWKCWQRASCPVATSLVRGFASQDCAPSPRCHTWAQLAVSRNSRTGGHAKTNGWRAAHILWSHLHFSPTWAHTHTHTHGHMENCDFLQGQHTLLCTLHKAHSRWVNWQACSNVWEVKLAWPEASGSPSHCAVRSL